MPTTLDIEGLQKLQIKFHRYAHKIAYNCVMNCLNSLKAQRMIIYPSLL